MEWVETTGGTVEQAKEAALDELGVDETDAEFEVVSEPRVGLFGRLRAEARVRARVRPTTPRAKEERRDRRRRSQGSGAAGTSAGSSDGPSDAGDPVGDASEAPSGPGRGSDEASPERQRGGREVGPSPEPSSAPSDRTTTAALSQRSQETTAVTVDVPMEEQARMAQDFLTGLAGEMGLEATATIAHRDEETVEVALHGDDLGVLIGQRGSTLSALQDLSRTVVQRQTGASNGRLLIDVAGYRAKRQVALARFADQVANEVRATGTRRALEPMSPADRKVVHDTVGALAGVATVSEGEDARRHVVIVPDEG